MKSARWYITSSRLLTFSCAGNLLWDILFGFCMCCVSWLPSLGVDARIWCYRWSNPGSCRDWLRPAAQPTASRGRGFLSGLELALPFSPHCWEQWSLYRQEPWFPAGPKISEADQSSGFARTGVPTRTQRLHLPCPLPLQLQGGRCEGLGGISFPRAIILSPNEKTPEKFRKQRQTKWSSPLCVGVDPPNSPTQQNNHWLPKMTQFTGQIKENSASRNKRITHSRGPQITPRGPSVLLRPRLLSFQGQVYGCIHLSQPTVISTDRGCHCHTVWPENLPSSWGKQFFSRTTEFYETLYAFSPITGKVAVTQNFRQ